MSASTSSVSQNPPQIDFIVATPLNCIGVPSGPAVSNTRSQVPALAASLRCAGPGSGGAWANSGAVNDASSSVSVAWIFMGRYGGVGVRVGADAGRRPRGPPFDNDLPEN